MKCSFWGKNVNYFRLILRYNLQSLRVYCSSLEFYNNQRFRYCTMYDAVALSGLLRPVLPDLVSDGLKRNVCEVNVERNFKSSYWSQFAFDNNNDTYIVQYPDIKNLLKALYKATGAWSRRQFKGRPKKMCFQENLESIEVRAVYRRWVNRRTASRLLESSANFTNPMFFICQLHRFPDILANSFSLWVF
jgi:hypothetical protein